MVISPSIQLCGLGIRLYGKLETCMAARAEVLLYRSTRACQNRPELAQAHEMEPGTSLYYSYMLA